MLEILNNQTHIFDRKIYRYRQCGRRYNEIEFNMRTDEIRLMMQTGPRKILGDNGLDPDHLIYLARDLIIGYNKLVSCKENEITIQCLNDAIAWQQKRREDRIARGVEGKMEV